MSHTARHRNRDSTGASGSLPLPARVAVGLEQDERLDAATSIAERLTAPLGRGAVANLLSGRWMGHALHPAMTDAPIGFFTSACVLDVLGGARSRPAAQRLVGLGLLSALPTAAAGWTEWHAAGQRDRRVGVVHAALNVGSLAAYTGSWWARRRGHHGPGVALGLVGSGLTGVSAYLGGHLASARAVATRHPALNERNEPVAASDGSTPTPEGRSPIDVLEVVAAQHGVITRLMAEVRTTDDASRPEALHRLFAYLAGHEAVEEVLLHPRAQGTATPDVGSQRIVEEEGAAHQIQRLEETGVDSPVFVAQFGLFEESITQHATAEQDEELPQILELLEPAEAELVVRAFRHQEAAAAHRTGSFAEMLEVAKHDVRGLAART